MSMICVVALKFSRYVIAIQKNEIHKRKRCRFSELIEKQQEIVNEDYTDYLNDQLGSDSNYIVYN